MLDVTPLDDAAAPPAEPQPQPLSLLDACLRLAPVMRHTGLSYAATADRMAAYSNEPYLQPYAFMSNHIIAFLRALAATEQAREDQQAVLEARVPSPRPSYGPKLREVG